MIIINFSRNQDKPLSYYEGKAAAVFGATTDENPYLGDGNVQDVLAWKAGYTAAIDFVYE